MASAAFKYVPQPAATTFALPSVWLLFYTLPATTAVKVPLFLDPSPSFVVAGERWEVLHRQLFTSLWVIN